MPPRTRGDQCEPSSSRSLPSVALATTKDCRGENPRDLSRASQSRFAADRSEVSSSRPNGAASGRRAPDSLFGPGSSRVQSPFAPARDQDVLGERTRDRGAGSSRVRGCQTILPIHRAPRARAMERITRERMTDGPTRGGKCDPPLGSA